MVEGEIVVLGAAILAKRRPRGQGFSATLSPPPPLWLHSFQGGWSRGRMSLLLSLPDWLPWVDGLREPSYMGILHTASTGPYLDLEPLGCGAGS